jgi:hypothetical protein
MPCVHREEAEEPKSVRKERKKRILDCAVDASWIRERSGAGYWVCCALQT